MELRTLRYFVHVADARSFSKASVFLRVAQPALSRQIRKLEDEIGMPLFVRAGHHLELTEAGGLLLNRAHLLLRQASNTLEEVRASATNLAGTLTIGVSPATSELVAPLLMRECAQRYPQLRLDFIEGFSRYVFEQLLNQGLTLCLIHNPPPAQGDRGASAADRGDVSGGAAGARGRARAGHRQDRPGRPALHPAERGPCAAPAHRAGAWPHPAQDRGADRRHDHHASAGGGRTGLHDPALQRRPSTARSAGNSPPPACATSTSPGHSGWPAGAISAQRARCWRCATS